MGKYPFSDGDTFSLFRNILEKVTGDIEALENDYVVKASAAELEQYFTQQATFEALSLDADAHYIEDQKGILLDVSHDFRRGGFGRERLVVKGTAITIAIPYSGDSLLWRVRPSSFGLSGYPEIEVRDTVIVFTRSFPDDAPEPDRLKADIHSAIRSLSETVENLARDVENHNQEAPQKIQAALERKIAKAKAAVTAVASLGIPIKHKSEPSTFVVPTRRRSSPLSRPVVQKAKFAPEPTLDGQEFEYILGVLKSMALVIERSPATFASLDEEAIRTHFLLQLNGHYEGAATGETFNASGKTDILIRVENRNIFIAECKFWRGPKSFDTAIDQLLSYMSWRDTKCALIVFNQAKNSSDVRVKMHQTMTARLEYRKTLLRDSTADARYIFVKSSDPGRELQIQTMLFDLPPK